MQYWYTKKKKFRLLSNLKEYDRSGSFPFDHMNQKEIRSAHSQKENCHYDHIPFVLKVI